jgi:sulfur carrier protein
MLIVNGEPHTFIATVAELVTHLGWQNQRVAVEVNETLVPRPSWPQHRLHPQDRVEIVRAIGGG